MISSFKHSKTIPATVLLCIIFLSSFASATINISNISPSDSAQHVEIVNNPPDPGGYTHLSWQINDTTGGDDMEFFMDIWNGTAWVNRQHQIDVGNGSWYQDETSFNTTNTTYQWRLRVKDGTDNTWNNQTYSFTTDRKPVVSPVYPDNNSYKEKGNVDLSAVVYHPDYTFGWTAVDLDGANDDVRVPDDNSLNFTSSFSVDMALWVEDNPADGKLDTIISKMTDANTGWGISLYGNGTTWELHVCVDGHNQSVGEAALPLQTWVYLTVVFDDDTHTMYVYKNASLVYSYYEPNTPSSNTADCVIGECSYVGNDKTFDGKIDYIKVYNVALTEGEVKANFYGKNDNGAKRGLVSWWKFDENTGTTTYDSWGNNDGTLEDGTGWATGSQSSTTYLGKIYNVSFYEYPSGRLIGYNSTTTGWTNGQIVNCNTSYYLYYNGTRYYWYAKAKDDEYWSDNSSVWVINTYYNDTEPTSVYDTISGAIYVKPVYTGEQPSSIYYTMGAQIRVFAKPFFVEEHPTNQSTNISLHPQLKIYTYKSGDVRTWNASFHGNDTVNETWVQIQDTKPLQLGTGANNLTIYDSNFSTGTLSDVEVNENNYLRLKKNSHVLMNENFEDGQAQGWTIQNSSCPESGVNTTDGVINPIGSYYLRAIGDDVHSSSTVDLSGYVEAKLEFYMGSRGLETGEDSILEIYDGSKWVELEKIHNNNQLQFFSKDITSYMSSSFQLRIFNNGTNDCTDFTYLDNVVITAYDYSYNGYRISPVYNLSGLAYDSGTISWSSTEPSGTSLDIYYSLSTDNGSTWGSWQTASNGGSINGISNLTYMDSYRIKFRQNFSTSDKTKTPVLQNLSLYIERYTPVAVYYDGRQYNTKYWWYVQAFNNLFNSTVYSDIYNFITKTVEGEPPIIYDTMSGAIYVKPVYTGEQPDDIYYTMGAQISVYYDVYFLNVHPVNGSTNQPINVHLYCWVNKSGDKNHYDIKFYSNDTVNETWSLHNTITQLQPNATANSYMDGLQYNTKYWWKITAENSTLGYYKEDIYHFTTQSYTDTEPLLLYNTMSGAIYVKPVYTGEQPSSIYYTMGAAVEVGLVKQPSNPYPEDRTTFGVHIVNNFSCYVEDTDNDPMNVTFYYASNDTAWATVHNVPSGSRAETTSLPAMSNGTTIQWYVIANDSSNQRQSPVWSYTPQNHIPSLIANPEDGENYAAVQRKSVTGVWRMFVKLIANVSDYEQDNVSIQIYVDDPSQPNWNDWILRLSHVEDTYNTYHNNPYIQDELLFNQTQQNYHWRVHLSDGYDSVDYYMNFTTQFYFWADFNWTPYHPTTDDTITLIDKSINATQVVWKINGVQIASKRYNSGSHTPFNLSRKFNISNIYNITLYIYNASANVSTEMHAETPGSPGYMYVDRNVTFNKTGTGAGVNYITYHLKNDTNASTFATTFNLSNGWWIHKYNPTSGKWESLFLYPTVSNPVGTNFNLSTWDTVAVTGDENKTTRINISENVTASQDFITTTTGKYYIGYSNLTSTTMANLTKIGLQTGDWVFKYDTVNGRWAYWNWIGYVGDDVTISGYDVLAIHVDAGTRIKIGWI